MKSPNTIFRSHPSLSEQELSDYLEGKLNDTEKNRIEQKIAQDKFHLDAFEGIEQNPAAMAQFEGVKSAVYSNISKKQVFWKFQYTIIIVATLALGITLMAPYIFSDENQSFFGKNIVKPSEKVVEPPLVTELSDEEIDNSDYIELEDMILAEIVISSSPVVMDDNYKIEPQVVNTEFEKALEIKKVDNPNLSQINLPTIEDIVYTNTPTFYVEKFLMVDYSSIYTEQIPVQVLEYQGTPANLESSDKVDNNIAEPKATTKFVTYKTYLFETQELFAAKNFKAALKRYNVILAHYPNDLNAHFYGGLCYFNLKQPSKALEHFDVAQKHQFNTFKLDAEWYSARAYYSAKDFTKCKAVLEKIINDNDHYSAQAKELMKKL